MKLHTSSTIAFVVAALIGCSFVGGRAFGQETPAEPGSISTEVRVRVVEPTPVGNRPRVNSRGEIGPIDQYERSVLSGINSPEQTDIYGYEENYDYEWDETCCGNFDCCGGLGGGSLAFDVEFTFLRFGQEGGVDDLAGSPGQFDLDLAPRFELGYELFEGLGVRARYWFYDEETRSAANNLISVAADQFDIEIFQHLDVGCSTDIEVSGGVRFLEFGRTATNVAAASAATFDTNAFGGIIGIRSKTYLRSGALYARARWGILQGDATVTGFNPLPIASYASDNTIQQLELAIGYELVRCTDWGVFTGRIGAEWQQWANVSIADATFAGNRDAMEDASFAGLVFGIGVQW